MKEESRHRLFSWLWSFVALGFVWLGCYLWHALNVDMDTWYAFPLIITGIVPILLCILKAISNFVDS
ncbi:MAG: hypothetical protein ACW97P_10125 [Candidatus Hodarchaeales archaeon]|jgi:hypothetical protein